VTVLESDPIYVGGIARTAQYKGFHFDIGGYCFFSKSQEVEDFWTEILPHDMLVRPRSSHIYYRSKFFAYPLKATVIQENNPGFLIWDPPGFSEAYWLLKNRTLSLHYCREALLKLGILEATRCVLSYIQAQMFPVHDASGLACPTQLSRQRTRSSIVIASRSC
jgi:hypothetical protein